MPSLLFESREDFKFYAADLSENTMKVIVCNHESDANAIFCEINLKLDEIETLEEWIANQRRSIQQNLKKQQNG